MRIFALCRCMLIIVASVCILFLPGCGSWGGRSAPAPSPIAKPSKSGSSAETPAAPRPIFYDFSDVPVPMELHRIASDSFVFQSGPFKAGLLTLKGMRVDMGSLINFFQVAMPRENWKQKGGFHSGRTMLIFEKPDKICVINIFEKMLGTYTYVEVYVAPVTKGQT